MFSLSAQLASFHCSISYSLSTRKSTTVSFTLICYCTECKMYHMIALLCYSRRPAFILLSHTTGWWTYQYVGTWPVRSTFYSPWGWSIFIYYSLYYIECIITNIITLTFIIVYHNFALSSSLAFFHSA
jgi:hypothetical protein